MTICWPFFSNQIVAISLDSHSEDEKGHLVWTQGSCSHLWRKCGRCQWIPKIVGTTNYLHKDTTRAMFREKVEVLAPKEDIVVSMVLVVTNS
jgi:hypothetical protein